MHFIDYIPWPIIVLILTFSVFIVFKFLMINKKVDIQIKMGALIMIIGGLGMIMGKIIQEASLTMKYQKLLEYAAIPTLIGFLILYGGIVKRVEEPEQKKKLKKYFIFLCIGFGLFGAAILYTIIVKGF